MTPNERAFAVTRMTSFASDPRGGNPAGVVLDAENLGETTMLRIAADVGYSETAFLTRTGTEEYTVRYFSPLAEVAFCGHATIAAAVHLADQIGPGNRVFQTPAGRIEVHTQSTPDGIVAGFQSVPTHSDPADAALVAEALSALYWAPTDLHPDWPAHVAFAGNDHLVLPVATRERLARLDYDFDALRLLMERERWTTVHLFWPETGDLFHARDPFPVGGVVEDPATGAAAAAFGGYLNAVAGRADRQVVIVQGQDMGRPSRITVHTHADTDRVDISGTAVPLPSPGHES
jgi:PhzF family phenazine biosynthesis protein